MKLNLKEILVPDMIHLYNQTWEVIYTNLMKATLKVSKLKSVVSKIENQWRHKKVENKVHQQQIKNIQGDLLTMDSEVDRQKVTHKIRDERTTLSSC